MIHGKVYVIVFEYHHILTPFPVLFFFSLVLTKLNRTGADSDT